MAARLMSKGLGAGLTRHGSLDSLKNIAAGWVMVWGCFFLGAAATGEESKFIVVFLAVSAVGVIPPVYLASEMHETTATARRVMVGCGVAALLVGVLVFTAT